MATATEIATRALRRLAVVDALESPAAQDISNAEAALNAMIAAWEAESLSGDVLPLDSRFEQGLTAMLAVRLAEDYGKTPGPVLVSDAKRGEMQIMGAFMAVPEANFELAYTHRHLASDDAYGTLSKVDNYGQWQSSTAYGLRMHAEKDGNLYEVVTAGTSGVTGPSGTGSEIADGTVVWCWRRVTA